MVLVRAFNAFLLRRVKPYLLGWPYVPPEGTAYGWLDKIECALSEIA
jgi:hypothetical protein